MKIFTCGEKLGHPDRPYMKRWVVDCRWFSLRLHHWFCGDDPRHFHDHPWWFLTLVLWGSYTDINPHGKEYLSVGSIRFRPALHKHTVSTTGCWTLLLTGPQKREWGFWVPRSYGQRWIKRNKYFYEHGIHQCD